MPRALLVCEPPDGGTAENVAQLALGLGRHGWATEVAGPRSSARLQGLAERGVPVHRLDLARGFGAPRRDLVALRAIGGLLRSGRFDLVHCHSAKAGVLGRVAASRAGVPAVYSPHCWPFVGDMGAARRAFAVRVERALGPRAAAIVCVCEDERRVALAARLADPARLHVVPNGCAPCDGAGGRDPALAALGAGGPVAAAVSVLRAQKRLDVLIDAAPAILAAAPSARVAIVGDGPLRGPLRARAAALGLDAEPRFAFLPFGGEMGAHLRALDVFVLPSGWEAMPIGVLEAMACGVPQVATDVGGTGEALSAETGALVPPGDPAALAAAVSALLLDPGRRARMAAASRARHAERFGVDRVVARTAAVYDAVRAQRG